MTLTETIKESIAVQGEEYILNLCMEEPAELIQAISKVRRYGADKKYYRENLIEEMADVYICINYLLNLYGLTINDIWYYIDKKQKRILNRIGEKS